MRPRTSESPFPVRPPGAKKFGEIYELQGQLGSGAFATVHKAFSKTGGQEVAVKVFMKKGMDSDEVANVRQEVKILEECDHPHILRFVSFFDEGQSYYLVTELLSGGELFTRICEKTSYTEAEARATVRVLLSALEYLHKRSIAHRDLKPENLLLSSNASDTEVKLADFGFAAYCGEGRTLDNLCGTPDYGNPQTQPSQSLTV